MENIFEEKNYIDNDIEKAKYIIEKNVKRLREITPNVKFPHNKLAELEINKFFYKTQTIDRVMVVLRANGCEHYKNNGGCSMCSHFNGTDRNTNITTKDYIEQWNSLIQGKNIEKNDIKFDLNNYPVVCVYNLGSLLNENEISKDAVRYIFKSLASYNNVEKVII